MPAGIPAMPTGLPPLNLASSAKSGGTFGGDVFNFGLPVKRGYTTDIMTGLMGVTVLYLLIKRGK
jgi:uncharacterized membrane protein